MPQKDQLQNVRMESDHREGSQSENSSTEGGTHMKFKVVYDVTKFEEETIEAESFDEAESAWLEQGLDARLFYIEDENGEKIIYD